MNTVAVVIADLVNSRHIKDRQIFQRKLKQILDSISRKSARSLLSPLTLTLGDEFQAVYGDFKTLFYDMMAILEAIHPYGIRIAIAHGPLLTDINRKAALEMDGPAFIEARMLIDRLKKYSGTMIQFTTAKSFNPEMINLCLRILSKEIQTWKPNTVRIFNRIMEGMEKDRIAAELNITVRAVDKQIANHKLRDFREMLEIISGDLESGLEMPGGDKD